MSKCTEPASAVALYRELADVALGLMQDLLSDLKSANAHPRFIAYHEGQLETFKLFCGPQQETAESTHGAHEDAPAAGFERTEQLGAVSFGGAE